MPALDEPGPLTFHKLDEVFLAFFLFFKGFITIEKRQGLLFILIAQNVEVF